MLIRSSENAKLQRTIEATVSDPRATPRPTLIYN